MRTVSPNRTLKEEAYPVRHLNYVCVRPKQTWYQYRCPVRVRIKTECPFGKLKEALLLEKELLLTGEEAISQDDEITD